MKETNGSTIIYHYLIGFLQKFLFAVSQRAGMSLRLGREKQHQQNKPNRSAPLISTFCQRSNSVSMWQHTHTHTHRRTNI